MGWFLSRVAGEFPGVRRLWGALGVSQSVTLSPQTFVGPDDCKFRVSVCFLISGNLGVDIHNYSRQRGINSSAA